MYQTYCNGKQYCFYEDRLCVNNAVIPYEMISNIKHRSGDAPAFLFEYGGRQFALPYPPGELPQILPYMKIASQTLPPLENVEPLPAEDMTAAAEPAFADPVVAEPTVADPFAADTAYAEPMVDESFPDPMVADSAAEDMYVAEPPVADPFAA